MTDAIKFDGSDLRVIEKPIAQVSTLSNISIAFTVKSIFDVAKSSGDQNFSLIEKTVHKPYIKDYDTAENEGPNRWARHFDLANWGLLIVEANDALIGGTVIAYNTPGVEMLEGRTDLAMLWDIRLHPDVRGRGVGTALFKSAELWSLKNGCREIKV
ncbi:MAG: GNAT family N-acetyltransferase, partial [Pseudomonadales bacterium]